MARKSRKPPLKGSTSGSSFAARFGGYQPVIERVLFGLSLLGVLVVAHLWIQAGRGFDRGCFGFSEPSPTFDCESVVQSDAGRLFGVSNVVWGLLYYLLLATFTFGVAGAKEGLKPRLKRARAALIVFGFVYSAYLVSVQYLELGEFCALCLTSALVATTLFGVQAYALFGSPVETDAPRRGEPLRLALATVALAVLVVADVAYFNRLTPSPAEGPTAQAAEERAAPAPGRPAKTAPASPDEPACMYNPDVPVVSGYEQLINISDPYRGNYDAPVTVIEYFDLNCPHCRSLHPYMQRIVEQNRDRARFYFIPFVLGQPSLVQTEALYAAAEQGKFFEMMDAQFRMQRQGGLSPDLLRAIATDLGMDPDRMTERLEKGTYRDMILQRRREIIDLGIKGVPTVMINGRAVASSSRTFECLNKMIADAADAS